MTISLEKLAEITGSDIEGDPKLELTGVAALDDAIAGEISFVCNPKYKKLLGQTHASAMILTPNLAQSFTGSVLINEDPYLTFAKTVFAFHGEVKTTASIHSSAVIDNLESISDSADIAAYVVIEIGVTIKSGCTIGAGTFIGKNSIIHENTFIYPNVTIYKDTIIGAGSIIHSGAVIGSDGFGFAPQKDKSWYKILQVGNVIIGKDVEIGACTTVDRAALGSTIINDGAKIDNQVQIAHNVEIGKYSVLAGGAMIAGSTTIGAYCQLGGMVGIAGHLNIVDNVIVTGRTMVTGSIKEPGIYSSGTPMEENRKWRRNAARFRHLDEMAKTLKKLEKQSDKKTS